jgi:hypothetical protein
MLLPPTAEPLLFAEITDAMNMITFATTMPIVAYPGTPVRVAPKAVRTGRCVRRPSAMHSGHW